MTATASRLFAVSIVARLPLAMLSIGLLVHTEHATASYGAAGLVAGAFALAQGLGGPVLGRLVDRRGQTLVLGGSALVAAAPLGGPPRRAPPRARNRGGAPRGHAAGRAARAGRPPRPRAPAGRRLRAHAA